MDATLKKIIETTDFQGLFERKGYAFFTKGDYNLNIFGIRDLREGRIQRDKFNDALVCKYKVNGKWITKIWDASTDPGLSMLKAPSTAKGVAILVPGQYRSVYQIDLHGGKYEALCQRRGPVKVYRDNNKDNALDFDPKTIESGMFGINIHRGKVQGETLNVGNYSAGCQVFRFASDFEEFMTICRKARNLYGNSFTYTLFTTDLD